MTSTTAATTVDDVPQRALTARRWLFWLTGVFMALLLAQAYLAGAFLMWDGDMLAAHTGLGWSLTYWPFLMLIAAALGRVGRRVWVLFAVIFVLVHVQPFFALLDRDSLGWARALHPLNGVALVLLSHSLMRQTRALGRHPGTEA